MFVLKEAVRITTNGAGSGILTIADTWDIEAGEFILAIPSYEVANPTISASNSGGGITWNPLTKQHDAGDVKGHQILWGQNLGAAKPGTTVTITFSTGVGFVDLHLFRFKVDGTVSLVAEGTTPTSGTATTNFTMPSVTGGMLLVGSLKMFGSTPMRSTTDAPLPLGVSGQNASRAHQTFLSMTPIGGTVTFQAGVLNLAENWIGITASFTDSGSPPAASYVPTWYSNAGGGSAIAVPGVSLLDACASQTNSTGTQDSARVFTEWSGGAAAPNGLYVGTEFRPGQLLYMEGQGHTFSGNSRYAVGPFNAEYIGINRLRDDTVPVPTSVDFDGSNNPVSRHSYSTLAYDSSSGRNRIFSAGARARYSDSGNPTAAYFYNLNQVSPNINSPYAVSATATGAWWWNVWDPVTALFWGQSGTPGTQVSWYDPVTDTTGSYTKTVPAINTPALAACDGTSGIICIASGGVITFVRTSTLSGAGDFYTPTTSGTAPPSIAGILFDPVMGRFVVFPFTSPNTVYYLTRPATSQYQGGNAWVWSTEVFTGATVDTPQVNGTYGRAMYVDAPMRGYATVAKYDGRVYFYKPADASPPTITVQPQTQIVNLGGTPAYTVTATNAISYQWKKNGTNVGTNSASYTHGAAAYADNGAAITVDVTNASGTTTSTTAYLLVAFNQTGTPPGPRSQPMLGAPTGAGAFDFYVSNAGSGLLNKQYSGSGLVQSGGSAGLAKAKAFTGSGLIQSGGAALLAKAKVFAASGLVQSASGAITLKVKAYTASGLVQSGGSATLSKAKSFAASGLIQSAGAGTTSFVGLLNKQYSGSGLVQSGGAAARVKVKAFAATGAVVIASTAQVSKSKAFAASGLIQSGGASSTSKSKSFSATGAVVIAAAALVAKVKSYLASALVQSGGAATTSTGGASSHTYSGSGLVQSGGTAARSKSKAFAASGLIQSSGAAGSTKTKAFAAFGLVQSGGAAATNQGGASSHTYAGSGLIQSAGAALTATTKLKVYSGSGLIQSGGAALLAKSKSFLGTGNLLLGGTTTRSRTKAYLTAGVVVIGGTALLAKLRQYYPTGIITIAGAAGTSYVDALGQIQFVRALVASAPKRQYTATGRARTYTAKAK